MNLKRTLTSMPNISKFLTSSDIGSKATESIEGLLFVQLFGAKDLTSKDMNGYSDPYAIVGLKNDDTDWPPDSINLQWRHYKSPTISATLNPIWNQNYIICPFVNGKMRKLVIQVWDNDAWQKDDFIGHLEFDIEKDLTPNTPHKAWIPLTSKSGNPAGSVHVEFTYKLKEEVKQEQEQRKKEIVIDVKEQEEKIAQAYSDYAAPDEDGNRFPIVGFMTETMKFSKIWASNDTSSPLSIWRPQPPPGWHILGDLAQRTADALPIPYTRILVVKEPPLQPNLPPLLAPPTSYNKIWDSTGTTGCISQVSIWEPIPPEGYHALGYIATSFTDKAPGLNDMRCVHQSALELAVVTKEHDRAALWSNKNLPNDKEISVWHTKPLTDGILSGTFIAHNGYHRPLRKRNYCLNDPPRGIIPALDNLTLAVQEKVGFSMQHTFFKQKVVPQKLARGEKRCVIAFCGGIDLTCGRWDTPSHTLWSTLRDEHLSDFMHGWGLAQEYGPREPWHDIHCKVEGPGARDLLKNFTQRWQKQGYPEFPLPILGGEFISKAEEKFQGDDTWTTRVCRSINKHSIDSSKLESGIQYAYVCAIRKAKRFIYIENQYFMGSASHWLSKTSTPCHNLVPFEIANTIAKSILAYHATSLLESITTTNEKPLPVVAYIVIPMYPEGYPTDAPIQEQLAWQFRTMQMMYKIVATAIAECDAEEEQKKKMHPKDYLNFFCLGQKEPISVSTALAGKDPPPSSTNPREFALYQTRRTPIYVHSKLMIVDDETFIIGSANINERSMAGDRDTEICVEGFQRQHKDVTNGLPRGALHSFRMALWREHCNESISLHLSPNSPACVHYMEQLGNKNWDAYMDNSVDVMPSHLMRYPIVVNSKGDVFAKPSTFPDTFAPVAGATSLSMPDAQTT